MCESLVPCAFLGHPPLSLAVFLKILDSSSSLLATEVPPTAGRPDRKNCLGAAMVDRMAFTWSTSSFDFWASSGPNRNGDTSPKLEFSSTRGNRALFTCVMIFVRRRWLIRALALPRSLTAVVTALMVCYDAPSSNSMMALRGARASSTCVWIEANSLSVVLVAGETSGFRKLSS